MQICIPAILPFAYQIYHDFRFACELMTMIYTCIYVKPPKKAHIHDIS